MRPARLARSAGFRLAMRHAALFAAAIAILFWIVYWATSSYAAHAAHREHRGPRATSWSGKRAATASADVADTINARLVGLAASRTWPTC